MKKLSVTRHEDWVRFSVSVEIEVKEGLEITCRGNGELSQGTGIFKGIQFTSIDDMDWEKVSLWGEKSSYKKLQTMWDQLFSTSFKSFEGKVDAFAEEHIEKTLGSNIKSVGVCRLKQLLRDAMETMDTVDVQIEGEVMEGPVTEPFINDWEVARAYDALTKTGFPRRRKTVDGQTVSGVSIAELKEVTKSKC